MTFIPSCDPSTLDRIPVSTLYSVSPPPFACSPAKIARGRQIGNLMGSHLDPSLRSCAESRIEGTQPRCSLRQCHDRAAAVLVDDGNVDPLPLSEQIEVLLPKVPDSGKLDHECAWPGAARSDVDRKPARLLVGFHPNTGYCGDVPMQGVGRVESDFDSITVRC